MQKTVWGQRPPIALMVLLVVLACTPFNRVQEFNQKGRVLATGVAVIGEGNYLALEAYEKLDQLPSYRLESRVIVRNTDNTQSTFTTTSDHDSQGNGHALIQSPTGQQDETYTIAGHTYIFETRYGGWIDLNSDTFTDTQVIDINHSSSVQQVRQALQLLTQFGAVPTEAGQETLQGRAVIRYDLNYVAADLAEAFGNAPDQVARDLQGKLWIDDQTGALLKSEILFYRAGDTQPEQELLLEISQIGAISPIELPSPIINPETIIAATATAQAWSVQQVALDYQGATLTFDFIPLEARPSTDASSKGQVRLILRKLPATLLTPVDTAPFLSALQQKLSLSVPQQNLVSTSSGFEVQAVDSTAQSIEVIYFFEADFADMSHVELIVSHPGNPLIATVPVVDGD